MEPQKFLSPKELHARWSGVVSIQTLANWRHLKYGPNYIKMGSKVLYPVDAIEQWESDRLHGLKPK